MKPSDELWAALARSGQLPERPGPSWARTQLAAQVQHLGAAAVEPNPAKEKQLPEREAPQLADMEIEP
jgi:hypothetical protein